MKLAIGLVALVLGVGSSAPLPTQIVIDLSLTPRAAERLASLGEGITVAAYHDGEPTKAHVKHADEMGMIALGIDRLTVAGKAQRIVMPLRKLDRTRVGWIVGGPHLLINLFTARRRNPDNLLNCDIYDGPLADVAGKPIAIKCDLI